MADYTDEQQDTIRRAVFGAMGLVSKADPGFFAGFSESLAGAKALAEAPPPIRGLLRGGLMAQTATTAAEFEAQTFDRLDEAMRITAGEPAVQAGLRGVVLAACQQVAEASKGVSAAEQAMIDRVRQAVSGPPAQGAIGSADAPAEGRGPVDEPGSGSW